jgi:hypothetical protein
MADDQDPNRWPAGNQSNPGTTTTPNPPPDSGLTDRPPQDAPGIDPSVPPTRERPIGSPAETGIDPGVARRWEEQEEERRRAEAAAAPAQAAPSPGPVTGTPAAAPTTTAGAMTSPEGAEKPPPIPPGEPRPQVTNPKDEKSSKRR